MNNDSNIGLDTGFSELTHERIIDTIEQAAGISLTPLCRPLNSYINRVLELEATDGTQLIAKFYRPGRWDQPALQEEHDFLLQLKAADLPVIAPMVLNEGRTLGNDDGIHFALFPKTGGRMLEELTEAHWAQLGRLVGRMHAVGETSEAEHRIVLDPESSTLDYLEYLIEGQFLPEDLEEPFMDLVEELVETISPLFEDSEWIRVHGDLHLANLINRPDEGLFLIDFDDFSMGSPVQDMWLLLPGYVHQTEHFINLFAEGYQTFRNFDRSQLRLVEPLRAMRYIHYQAWCARQHADGTGARAANDFGSHAYWQQEIKDLQEQLHRINQLLH